MADTLFKGKPSDPRLEEIWPFCTVDTKHVAVEVAMDSDVQVSNQTVVLSCLRTAPRARKSPRQDDYEVNIASVKLSLVANKARNEVSLLATKELIVDTVFSLVLQPPPSSLSSKRPRTTEDFLLFCKFILDYENYEMLRHEVLCPV